MELLSGRDNYIFAKKKLSVEGQDETRSSN